MAQKTVVIYTDDLTGEKTDDIQTHSLVLDGVPYEFDLTPDSYDKLLEAVAPFTRVGRKPKTGRAAAGRKSAKANQGADGASTHEIREWAKSQGYEVNERGRVPARVREAFIKR